MKPMRPADYASWSRAEQDAFYAKIEPQLEALATEAGERPPSAPVKASPFVWIDPAAIPRRQWLYGRHYVRKFISETVAPGAYGKSTLAITEALAMVTGRALLDVTPNERANVWYWNGEDPMEGVTASYYRGRATP